jgi:hypothetical protein
MQFVVRNIFSIDIQGLTAFFFVALASKNVFFCNTNHHSQQLYHQMNINTFLDEELHRNEGQRYAPPPDQLPILIR